MLSQSWLHYVKLWNNPHKLKIGSNPKGPAHEPVRTRYIPKKYFFFKI